MSNRTWMDWVRTFRDVGVVRVGFDDDVLIAAIHAGNVEVKPCEDNWDALDCRLSAQGKGAYI